MVKVSFFSLILLSVLLTCSIAQSGPRVKTSDDGELEFIDFKPICEYNAPDILNTPPASASFGNIAAGFVRTVAPGTLADILEDINLEELFSPNAAAYIESNASTFVTAFVAIPIFFVLGIVLAALVPFCGCIFCCCRCCGNCGGKREQYAEDNVLWKRCILVCLLLAVAILLGVGTASVFLGGSTFTGTFETSVETIDATSTDFNCYINSIFMEFEYLVEVADETVQLAVDEVQGTSEEVSQLLGEVEMVFNNVSMLVDSAQRLSDTLSLVSAVRASEMNLSDALSEFSSSYDMTLSSTECQDNSACFNANNNKDLSVFGVNTNLESLADVTSQQESLSDFLAQDLSTSAENVLSELGPIRNVFQDGNVIPADVFNASTFNSFTSEGLNEINTIFTDFSQILQDLDTVANQVTQYGFIASAVLASFIGMICVVYVLGIIFGEIGRKRHDVPEERVCLAKCGGCLLVVGWIFSFLFYFTMALLAAFYFLFGSAGEVFFCQTLRNPTSLDTIKDAIIQFSATDNMTIADISISNAFEICADNGPIWEALDLDKILGDSITNAIDDLQDSLDIASEVKAINVGEALKFEDQRFLTDLASIDFTTVDFTGLSSDLQNPPVGDLASVVNDIQGLASSVGPGQLADSLEMHATDLQGIISNELATLNDNINALRPQISSLETEADQLVMNADQVKTDVARLSANATGMIDQAINDVTPTLVEYINQTVNYVLLQIRTNVGRCSPVYSVYRSVEYIFCDNLLNGMNAMWLGFGIAVIFFIFGIILAVKLSKYYRLMYNVDGYDGENYENIGGQEGYPNYNNKNYPV